MIDAWNAIWAGIAGGIAMWLLLTLARAVRLVDTSLIRYEGSLLTGRAEGAGPWLAGLVMHLVLSALIGLAYAVGFASFFGRAAWNLGIVLGVYHWGLASLVLPLMDSLNPCVKRGSLRGMGAYAWRGGMAMVAVFLIGHLLYGLVVGWLYTVPAGWIGLIT
ncbi:MAG TPA: hypothetical protein VF171_07770 [Trueperaceae bacterium]